MNRLQSVFSDEITFVVLDWDDRDLEPIRDRFGITGRTQYVLLDEDENVIQRWYGPLDYETVSADIEAFLNE